MRVFDTGPSGRHRTGSWKGSLHVTPLLESPHYLVWACESCFKVSVTVSINWRQEEQKKYNEEFKNILRLLISRINLHTICNSTAVFLLFFKTLCGSSCHHWGQWWLLAPIYFSDSKYTWKSKEIKPTLPAPPMLKSLWIH